MSDYPEPTTFTGSDERDLTKRPKSIASLFWRAYGVAVRQGDVPAFLDRYRRIAYFARLVAEAERVELERREAEKVTA